MRSMVEGSHGEVCAEADGWDPSVSPAAIHLPVPGRNWDPSVASRHLPVPGRI